MNTSDYFVWDVSPEIFSIGPFHIRWYGLLFALGFIVGYQLMWWIFKREKKDLKELETLTIYMIVGTIIGARLGHCLLYDPIYYLSNPLEILMIWKGGLASHGAAFADLVAMYIFSKRSKQLTFSWILDRMVVVIPPAACFIRLGNFFNSEILGRVTDVPWAVIFPRADDGILLPRHPVQLYEAIAYLIIFVVILLRYKNKYQEFKANSNFALFLLLVFGARFILEFFKEEQAAFQLPIDLTMGQLLSLPLIILGIVIYFYPRRNNRG